MDNLKKIINSIYRKCASLNLYTSVCRVEKERISKELADIKLNVETAEKILKRL